MNTQQEMMRILQATNAYYQSPTTNGWEPGTASDAVFATHKTTGRIFLFTLNQDTKVIKAESYSFKKPGSITIYTGTITLGGRLIAPDMILTLHTLFNFNFASDATFVVEKNHAKLIPAAKTKRKFSIASDESLVKPKFPAAMTKNIQVQNAASFTSMSRRRKVSKVLRFFVYFESPFRR
jgi:hypothetical protein